MLCQRFVQNLTICWLIILLLHILEPVYGFNLSVQVPESDQIMLLSVSVPITMTICEADEQQQGTFGLSHSLKIPYSHIPSLFIDCRQSGPLPR